MTTTKVGDVLENLPSNEKIQKSMDTVKREITLAKEAPGVDSTGQKILDDTHEVFSSAQAFIREKNEGDKVQQLLKEGHKATLELQEQADRMKAAKDTLPTIDTQELKMLAERTLETARLAGLELISSSSFRNSIRDFLVLSYDIIKEGTDEGGAKKHGKKHGKKRGSKGKQIEGEKQRQPPQLEEKEGVEGLTQAMAETKIKRKTISDVEGVDPTRRRVISDTKPSTIGEIVTTSTGPVTTEEENLGDQVPDRVKSTTKEGIETALNKGLGVAGSRKRVEFTDDQINNLFDRFLRIVRNVSQRERSKNVMVGLLDIFRFVGNQLEHTADVVAETGKQSAMELKYNKHVRKTLLLSKELFENFSGPESLDPLLEHVREVYNLFAKDQKTRQYFLDMRDYVKNVIENPQLLEEQQYIEQGKRLIRRGRKLKHEEVYNHIEGIVMELQTIIANVQNDPTTKKLRKDMKKLLKDVVLDSSGNIVLKEHALEQLRVIVISSLVERLRIPLPTIRMEDKDMAYTIKNLVISLKDLVPSRVVIENRGRLALNLADVKRPGIENASNNIRLLMQNLNMHMENADIWFRRKTFPKMEDRGKVRLDVDGRGMDIVVNLITMMRTHDIFRVDYVDCDLHNMSLGLSDTRHDFLYNMVLKMLSGRIKRGVETGIEDALRNQLELLNRMLRKQIKKATQMAQTTGPKLADTGSSVMEALKSGASTLAGNK